MILLDEPTQGIDIGAKALIHGLIRKAADDGAAVVVATSDDEEICDICVSSTSCATASSSRTKEDELSVDDLGLLKHGGSTQRNDEPVVEGRAG